MKLYHSNISDWPSPNLGRSRNIGLAACLVAIAACGADINASDRSSNDIAVQSEQVVISAVQNASATNKVVSEHSFDVTLARTQTAIESRGFKTFAVVDHAAGAASIGEPLRPTTLIIFGNPKGGTPLIQSQQLMGLALPLKMLVYQNGDGSVEIAWTDMAAVFQQYDVADQADALAKISGALKAIADEAANSEQ